MMILQCPTCGSYEIHEPAAVRAEPEQEFRILSECGSCRAAKAGVTKPDRVDLLEQRVKALEKAAARD